MLDLFREDENSTRQTGRVTFDFHSPGSFATHIVERASAKGKHWSRHLRSITEQTQGKIDAKWMHAGSSLARKKRKSRTMR